MTIACCAPLKAFIKKDENGKFLQAKFNYEPGSTPIELPCKNCILCQAKRRRELALKMNAQMETCDNKGLFLTLTYNNNNISPFGLNYADLSAFNKRLKQYFKRHLNKDIDYVLAGEYGSRTHRPHFHEVIFGASIEDIDDLKENCYNHYESNRLQNCWSNLGYVCIMPCTAASCGYTTGYTMKKLVKVDNNYLNKIKTDTANRNKYLIDNNIKKVSLDSKKMDRIVMNEWLVNNVRPEDTIKFQKQKNKELTNMSQYCQIGSIKGKDNSTHQIKRKIDIPHMKGRVFWDEGRLKFAETVRVSQGLGNDYFLDEDRLKRIITNRFIYNPNANGEKFAIPRSLDNIIKERYPEEWEKMKQNRILHTISESTLHHKIADTTRRINGKRCLEDSEVQEIMPLTDTEIYDFEWQE